MDIRYLLLLQEFRNSINDSLTPFMEMISLFAVTYLGIVPAFVYWCIDKRNGLYTLASYYTTVAVNAVIKLTACVYRPWIKDPRVIPAGDAITTATGYSFPSGHTATAVPIYGGLAVSTVKKMRWIAVLCIVCIAVTGFSRNYLGVHTPQDVIIAMFEGLLSLWTISKLFSYLDAHPDKENIILLAAMAACVLALIYISCKSYPVDYKADGELLVDPYNMKKDGFGDIGYLFAFCAARLIEKTWIRFEPKLTKENLAAGLVGAVIAFMLIQSIGDPLKSLLGLHWGAFAKNFVIVMFIVAIWPAVIKKVSDSEADH